jgi:hypothetical protein
METPTTFRVTFLRLSTPSQAATPNCITSETNKGGSLHSLSRSARQTPQLACQFAWIQHHKKVSRRWGFRRLGRGSGGSTEDQSLLGQPRDAARARTSAAPGSGPATLSNRVTITQKSRPATSTVSSPIGKRLAASRLHKQVCRATRQGSLARTVQSGGTGERPVWVPKYWPVPGSKTGAVAAADRRC